MCTHVHTYYIHVHVFECSPFSLLSPSTIPLSEEFDEALHGGGLPEEAFDAEDSFDVSEVWPHTPLEQMELSSQCQAPLLIYVVPPGLKWQLSIIRVYFERGNPSS